MGILKKQLVGILKKQLVGIFEEAIDADISEADGTKMVKLLVMTIIMNVNQIVVSLVKPLKALVRQLVVSCEAILSH